VRSGHGHWQDAGVGHDDVDLAEIGQACLDSVAQLVPLAYVGDFRHHAAADLFEGALSLREIVGRRQGIWIRRDVAADVDGDDVGAFLGHRDGMRPALPTRCTRDECDLALKPSGHASPAVPPRRGRIPRSPLTEIYETGAM